MKRNINRQETNCSGTWRARQAYLIGNKALAKELSVKGQLHNMHMKEAHGKAQESIYRQRNPVAPEMQGNGRAQERMIDLHGLHVSEALHVLKHELSVLRSTARAGEPGLLVYICVGTATTPGVLAHTSKAPPLLYSDTFLKKKALTTLSHSQGCFNSVMLSQEDDSVSTSTRILSFGGKSRQCTQEIIMQLQANLRPKSIFLSTNNTSYSRTLFPLFNFSSLSYPISKSTHISPSSSSSSSSSQWFSVIRTAITTMDLQLGKRVHALIITSGNDPDHF
ncbi:hypothetical protein GBA52_028325 [Prunus armeniaca]|nr:hypothetical protein GBA52_028325 [Prunus armeniaca]